MGSVCTNSFLCLLSCVKCITLVFTIIVLHIIVVLPSESFKKELYFSLGKRLLAIDWLMEDNAVFREKVSEALYGSKDFFHDPFDVTSLDYQDEEDQVDEDYDEDENFEENIRFDENGKEKSSENKKETYTVTVKLCPTCGIPANMEDEKCTYCDAKMPETS